MSKTIWQNRILGFELVQADDLLANPFNARRHPAKQRDALRASLDTLGWVAPILVNRATNYVIDGHARIEESLTKDPSMLIPVLYVDISPEEEKQFLLTFDYITYMAEYDRDILSGLMDSIDSANQAVQEMLSELAEREGKGATMPSNVSALDYDPPANVTRSTEYGDAVKTGSECPSCGLTVLKGKR